MRKWKSGSPPPTPSTRPARSCRSSPAGGRRDRDFRNQRVRAPVPRHAHGDAAGAGPLDPFRGGRPAHARADAIDAVHLTVRRACSADRTRPCVRVALGGPATAAGRGSDSRNPRAAGAGIAPARGADPRPAAAAGRRRPRAPVILLHGCGGIGRRYPLEDWAQRLLSWGYGALTVDSLTARGVSHRMRAGRPAESDQLRSRRRRDRRRGSRGCKRSRGWTAGGSAWSASRTAAALRRW